MKAKSNITVVIFDRFCNRISQWAGEVLRFGGVPQKITSHRPAIFQ